MKILWYIGMLSLSSFVLGLQTVSLVFGVPTHYDPALWKILLVVIVWLWSAGTLYSLKNRRHY